MGRADSGRAKTQKVFTRIGQGNPLVPAQSRADSTQKKRIAKTDIDFRRDGRHHGLRFYRNDRGRRLLNGRRCSRRDRFCGGLWCSFF